MSVLEALDQAGSLIILVLAAGNLPHTCLKVMMSHLRDVLHNQAAICYLLTLLVRRRLSKQIPSLPTRGLFLFLRSLQEVS